MSYTADVSLTVSMIAERLSLTPKRVREIAKNLKLKPSWIGPLMTFTPMQFQKMRDRNTSAGRPAVKRKRR